MTKQQLRKKYIEEGFQLGRVSLDATLMHLNDKLESAHREVNDLKEIRERQQNLITKLQNKERLLSSTFQAIHGLATHSATILTTNIE